MHNTRSISSILFVLFIGVVIGQGQTFKPWFESPVNGQVNSIVVAGNTAYLGGTFTQCGFSTGYGVAVDTGSADADHYFPKFFRTPGGQAFCAVPDSQGGWYIGGSFSTVNGQPHKYLAHVRADKSVDPWNPSPNGPIQSIYYSGNKIYVGGLFDTVASQARGNGAAFDTSGNLLAWDPKADREITAIQPVGAKVFVGGGFYSLGGQPYHFLLGSVDSSTGALTGWNPSNGGPSGSFGIYKFIYANHQIYMVGSFTTLNGVNRICLAKMDENGTISTTWNPCSTIVGNFVSSMVLYNGKIYACGDFTSIGGQTKKNIAEIDTATGLATSWNPASTNGAVRALVVNGSKMFIGGSFTSIGAKSISYLGALDAASGAANNWNPGVNNVVFNLASWGSTVYAGGYLTVSGLTTRNRLAAVDLGTGRLKSWNPNSDGTVFALAYAQGKIYAGGSFSYVASGYRPGLTALDTINGAYISSGIASSPGGNVLSLAVTGNRLYAGGNYGLAAYNIPTGKKLSFNPTFDYTVVQSLCASDTLMYAGGTFQTVNGIAHSNIVAFDTTTDQPISWNPSLSSSCYSIAVAGSKVYLGGSFSTVNGASSPSVAVVDAKTGNLIPGFTSNFSPVGYKVSVVAVGSNQLYVGGQFSPVGSITGTDYLAILDATTGAVSSFRSGMVASEVTSIVLLPQSALVGGSFVTYTNWPQYNFAGYGDTSIHSVGFPILQVRSNPTNFDTVIVGNMKSKILYLTNAGTDTLHIKNITMQDSVFGTHLTEVTIAPKQTVIDTISFSPLHVGTYSSYLLITSNAASSVDTVFLNGIGIGNKYVQLAFSAEPMFFGGVYVGSFKDHQLSITNAGNDTAGVTVKFTNDGFLAIPDSFLLAPDSTKFVTIRFQPNDTINFLGKCFVSNFRTTPSIDSFAVVGKGLSTDTLFVQLQFSQSHISFGGVNVGSQKDSILSIKNIGNDTADVVIGSTDSAFAAIPNKFLLAPDSLISLTLRFTPDSSGEYFAHIIISNSRTTPSIDTINVTGLGKIVNAVADLNNIPKEFSLSQNYPNPFNPSTTINYQLPMNSYVSLKVYDILGKEVATLVNGEQKAGSYDIRFDASKFSSGMYFYRITAVSWENPNNHFVKIKQMMLLK